MLATSFRYEVNYHTTLLPMTSQVPRCLFGKPNPRDTIEMLQEALDAERSRFAKRWGVNPLSEDKENNYQRRNKERIELSPNKKRSNPYSRQTNIHDFWRSRKSDKKPLATSMDVVSKQHSVESKTTKTPVTTTPTKKTTLN
ncbi:uncharacterized protein LOC109857166 [Pseudomyrmex gracilis]|uniref:uncharacterized protein LOC109857166 n=1 Tax=Pseudomyrmex gracilis TaxID=219809 RepID=UPI0009959BF4|nr:uncharacterized protein LOC109857166 [Pseudomyrmex gracilis]